VRRTESAANGSVVDIREPSLGRHVPHEFRRNAWRDFTP
jgi:hypothetical protein